MSDSWAAVLTPVLTILMTALVGGGGFGAVGLLYRRHVRLRAQPAPGSPTAQVALAKVVEETAERMVLAANNRTAEYVEDARAARADARDARSEAAAARAESAALRAEVADLSALVSELTSQNAGQRRHIEALEADAEAAGRPVTPWTAEDVGPVISHDRRSRDEPHDGPERRRSTT